MVGEFVCVCMFKYSEWVNEWVSESVSESVSEWVSQWVSQSVSEGAHCPTPATQKRRRRRDASGTAGAYIRPLDSAHCPTPATQKQRSPRDASGTPGRTSDPLTVHIVPRLPRKRSGDPGTPAEPLGMHPTPWQCTTQKKRRPRDASGTPGRASDPLTHAKEAETQGRQRNPGACIRPLGSAHCPTPATQKRRRPRDASGTPGRTSDPLAVHIVTLSFACHAKEAETQGRQRNPGAYIRPLGSAHCPTPATQKRQRPCRDASGTPGRTSDPLAVHIVPRLPRKRVSEWVNEWVSEWVSEWMCVCEWVSECVWVSEWVEWWVRDEWGMSEWVSEGVSEGVSEWASECVCEWVSECEWVNGWVCVWVEGTGGGRQRRRKADTELKTKTPHVNVGNN